MTNVTGSVTTNTSATQEPQSYNPTSAKETPKDYDVEKDSRTKTA